MDLFGVFVAAADLFRVFVGINPSFYFQSLHKYNKNLE